MLDLFLAAVSWTDLQTGAGQQVSSFKKKTTKNRNKAGGLFLWRPKKSNHMNKYTLHNHEIVDFVYF